jgi:hypothetical protein
MPADCEPAFKLALTRRDVLPAQPVGTHWEQLVVAAVDLASVGRDGQSDQLRARRSVPSSPTVIDTFGPGNLLAVHGAEILAC